MDSRTLNLLSFRVSWDPALLLTWDHGPGSAVIEENEDESQTLTAVGKSWSSGLPVTVTAPAYRPAIIYLLPHPEGITTMKISEQKPVEVKLERE